MRVSRRECVNRLGKMKSFAEIPRVQKKRCFYYYQELAADFSFFVAAYGLCFWAVARMQDAWDWGRSYWIGSQLYTRENRY